MVYRKDKLPSEVPCEMCGKLHPRKVNRPCCRSCGTKKFWLGRERTPFKAEGYVRVYIKKDHPFYPMALTTSMEGGRILEHRLIMAEYLGRLLLSNEIVHHLNGIRDDNRLENLALVSGRENHEGKTLIRHLRTRIKLLEETLNIIN